MDNNSYIHLSDKNYRGRYDKKAVVYFRPNFIYYKEGVSKMSIYK